MGPAQPATPPEPFGRAASERAQLDAALAALAGRAPGWSTTPPAERRALLAQVSRDILRLAGRWVELLCELKGLDPGTPAAGEDWISGPYLTMRNVHLLRRALIDIEHDHHPQVPGGVRTRPDGRVVARVFPENVYDQVFYPGLRADVWMDRDLRPEELAASQAIAYRDPAAHAGVALVLGGGNVSSIAPMDVLWELFVRNKVVMLKVHPVMERIGPLLEEALGALVRAGVLRFAYGGAGIGAWLCEHEHVDEVHVTGSDRTFEAIVFGTGEEGARRKAEGRPKTTKRVTGELGNVSPVIIVPDRWSSRELDYQALNLASKLANNAGFNCNAGRVVVQHQGWKQREELLDALRARLATVPTRRAYYPGAFERHARFIDAHPEAERLGRPSDDHLPWTLISDVDPAEREDPCFRVEAFCSLMAETALEAPSRAAFLRRAVEFCNETLWGTLNATIIVAPRTLRDPAMRVEVERAVEELRYGTVCLNHWAALGYGLGVTTWGAFPGHTPDDIQSGVGHVHDTLMFSRAEKSVVRSLFRAFPKPPWFVDHKTAHKLGPRLVDFEAHPSFLKLPAISALALRA